ncbi:family 43 glycosylhydrolase [Microbacterium proteolyticum]|uniref:glycoside hydrolase family 43 protein n=1 Tax=Microbacterium proteolyticum TaxID=1572644 RepID=UPI002417C499|nr:glycoside hydrolase family 43 protein [Microbacterium proteolyticum]
MTDYPNPLVPGFHPDPSAVRVGDTWYLATSTFEYLPGIPIHRSTDFVTWELIGHVATRPGQLGVEDVRTAGGAWAPTLRHRDGVFHLVVTDAMGRGMLHFTATDPAGPWSDGDLITDSEGRASLDGIDPDIAWDADGVAIITYSGLILGGEGAGRHLGILQARVDLDTHRALEEPRSLWSGTGGQFPEAPHLYEIDGRWYLLIAEGGTERGHGVSIARADRPEGPFETGPANPIVSARSTIRPVQNTGHGDLVIGPDGEWLCVLLGVRPRSMTRAFSALGRETFVTRVQWHADGWPTMEPVTLNPRSGTRVDVTFSPEVPLDGEWITPRRLPTELADLTTRPGWLVLRADGSSLDDPRPVFVGRRQEHLTQSTSLDLDCTAGVGGLAVRYDESFHVEVEAGAGRIVARANVAGLVQEWAASVDSDRVTLHIESRRPDVERGFARTSDVFHLAATVDGRRIDLAEVDGRFLSSETAESFTGRVVGVYAREGRVDAAHWTSEGDDA